MVAKLNFQQPLHKSSEIKSLIWCLRNSSNQTMIFQDYLMNKVQINSIYSK